MIVYSALLIIAAAISTGVTVGFLTSWIPRAWDRIAQQQIAQLSPRLVELRLSTESLSFYLRLWGALMLAILIIFGFLIGIWPIAIGLIYLVYVAPNLILSALVSRRMVLMRDQMVTATVGMTNACRAGLSLFEGISTIAEELPQPLAEEFHVIVHQVRGGRPLAESLIETKKRLRIDGFTIFASAIVVCLERGGRLTTSLEAISESLQEQRRLERKIEADTQTGKKVAIILSMFPIIFLGFFYLIEPEGVGLMFSNLLGQVLLLLVMAIVYFSARWCQRILSIDV